MTQGPEKTSGPTLANEPTSGQTIKTYLAVLNRRKWWLITCLVCAIGLSVLYTKNKRPVYRATSSVIIEKSPPQVLAGVKEVVDTGASNYWISKEYFQTQEKVISGMQVVQRVVDKLRLDEIPEYLDLKPGQRMTLEEKRRRIADRVPARILQSRITVKPVRDTLIMRISVEDTSPERAARIANELAFEYKRYNMDYRKSVIHEANTELDRMVTEYRQKKEQADKALLEFERQHNVGSFQTRKEAIEEQVKMLHRRRAELRLEKVELEAKLARVRPFLASRGTAGFVLPLKRVLDSDLINDLKSKLLLLKYERAGLGEVLGEKHPKIKELDRKIREVRSALEAEVKAYLDQVEGDYREVVDTLSKVESLLAQASTELMNLGELQMRYNTLLERKQTASDVYKQVRDRYMETTLTAQVEANNVRIHELALPPSRPVSPDLRINLAAGLLLGLVLGMGLAFVVETLDNTIKSRVQAEMIAESPSLGVIPSIPDGDRRHGRKDRRKKDQQDEQSVVHRDFYILEKPRSAAAEAVNTIRTNLLFVLPDTQIKTVLITSPNPWEGKSTVAVMLASTMARYDSRTLLVDGDMRRPRLHKTFSVEAVSGLSTILAGTGNLDDSIKPTNLENLFLLPAGPVPPNPSDLLQSRRLQGMMDRLKELFDCVIVDSPPVIPVADPRILGRCADGVVLVVKPGRTTTDSLAQAARELRAVSARIVGIVLNNVTARRRRYGYGYGYYGYGYGYYGEYGYYTSGTSEDEEEREPTRSVKGDENKQV